MHVLETALVTGVEMFDAPFPGCLWKVLRDFKLATCEMSEEVLDVMDKYCK